MKTLSFFLLLLIVMGCVPAAGQTTLEKLFRDRQFFELRDELVKRPPEQSSTLLFYRGIVSNRFNKLDDSILYLQDYLRSGNSVFARDAYESLADAHLRKGEYGKAADTYKVLIEKFAKVSGLEKMKDYKNSYGLWNALRDIPPQRVEMSDDSSIQGTRDAAGLLNVPVEVGKHRLDLVFDTGANLSTITISTANRLGLRLIEADIAVGSSSSIKVKSKLAVAESLKIGSAVVHNVIFLVMEDKALYFPKANYQIHGIIGLPVMEALGSLTIAKTDVLTINANSRAGGEPNMCLEDLNPLVEGEFRGKKMIFALDSGAASTTFYVKFFRADRTRILKNAKPKLVNMGGAGGSVRMSAYYLNDLDIEIGGQAAHFAKAEIITKAVNEDSRNFYGNLGQDLIKQFVSMTLDFRSMTIAFR